MTDTLTQSGRLILDLAGHNLLPDERELLQHAAVGGVILFSRNYAAPGQLRDLIADIRQANPRLLICVDQEGGRVQRLRDGFTQLPAPHSLARHYAQDSQRARQLAELCGWLMAAEVLQAGIDLSFAPVLDLYSEASEVIAERAFAADVNTVTELGLAYIRGMHRAGMAATGKHYPGHGSVMADSHVELPADRRDAGEILDNDFRVFADCCPHLDAIMPAHVVYPAIDQHCAGFSRLWLLEKLRGELNFQGVIFSDDLTMAAAHSAGPVEARLESALQAGCDVVLVCNDRASAIKACGWLERENIARSNKLLSLRGQPAKAIADLQSQAQWRDARAAIAELRTP